MVFKKATSNLNNKTSNAVIIFKYNVDNFNRKTSNFDRKTSNFDNNLRCVKKCYTIIQLNLIKRTLN